MRSCLKEASIFDVFLSTLNNSCAMMSYHLLVITVKSNLLFSEMLEPFNLFWMEREIYEEEDVNWWDGNGEVKEEEKGAIPKPSLFFTSDADFILTMAHRLNDTVEHRVFISDRQDREIVDFLELVSSRMFIYRVLQKIAIRT